MEKEWVSMHDRKTADELGYKLCYDQQGCIINKQENGITYTLMAFIRPTCDNMNVPRGLNYEADVSQR